MSRTSPDDRAAMPRRPGPPAPRPKLHGAAADLYQLNPQDGSDPTALSRRFLGWAAPPHKPRSAAPSHKSRSAAPLGDPR
ncbi:hypothetical protein [Micromonospora tarensis]|uniref:Uncharacterized protein n=1 Tax=Micromonospora tarensis TaxID=2806100 RepID=A0ABS1YPK2_9ACTN|nr:hypothetical protein [Micromonospora tarensis]MBM0279377.1 hypothetical protein [Micromonospora tarensis]